MRQRNTPLTVELAGHSPHQPWLQLNAVDHQNHPLHQHECCVSWMHRPLPLQPANKAVNTLQHADLPIYHSLTLPPFVRTL